MSSMGCPQCGRTPVFYILSQKFWQCRHCRYTWREEDGIKEPVYFVADKPAKTKSKKPGAVKKKAVKKKKRP
ncbi:MAG: hypothetical protein GF350_09390 [Chitinivibrionales bacterium]|nr:hypothetical protein [Chitinivibrionales bacterium]